ncbi:secretory carrier-associated membrane protein 4-like isoform X2 [Oncorhynchus keta]|uniref:secretory carrier-associated membrane protein 4-like isoform X2 n=1 Tax=Oncorhynchus keta TaxID=8018 RepID=UPI0015FBD9E6|nr:secretory carrier-associated membrane protein 4-like isoform X2 [Oncorhynchus keta]
MMTERVNNFPPLPQFLRIKPCFYQNVEEEIPAPHRQLVSRVYNLWMLYSVTLCVNVVSCIAWWAGGGSGANFGLSLLWLLLFSPCSYTCWFRPLYKAFRVFSLSFRQWASLVGVLVLFFRKNVGSAVVMLFSALLFTLVTVLMGLILIRVHRLYRGGGGSFERAQEEWTTGLWKSAPVREAGFNAVTETGPSLPQYPADVPSYPDNGPW